MKYAKWQHWINPRTKKWDAQCYKNANVLFFSRQGYANEKDCLKAIQATRPFWAGPSTLVLFKDRVRSRKS